MPFGKTYEKTEAALAEMDEPLVKQAFEQARFAQNARRKSFVARLPLPDGQAPSGDVQQWAAVVERVQGFGFELRQWSVCPEATGPVAYAVFVRS